MYCKSCGSMMEDSYNVCQICGAKKGTGSAFCEGCGQVRQVGTMFCANCGTKYADEAAPADNQGSTPYSQQTTAQQFQSVAQMDNSQYMPPKKFCRNCGKQVMNNQAICTACGVKVGTGESFCSHCGQPTTPGAAACMSCGMSLSPAINFNDQAKGFVDNLKEIFVPFNLDKLLENGAALVSVLTFLLLFFPTVYIYVSASYLGYSASSGTDYNVFGSNGFAGFLYVLAFIVGVASFVPAVRSFIEKNNTTFGQYASLAPAALMLVGMVLLIISVLRGSAAAGIQSYSSLVTASCGFTFFGWLFIIFSVAGIGASVVSFLKKKGIVKF